MSRGINKEVLKRLHIFVADLFRQLLKFLPRHWSFQCPVLVSNMEPTRRNLPIFHFLTICCTIQFFQLNWNSTEFQLKLNGVVYARPLAYTLHVQVYHMCASICDVMLQAPNMWCNAANIHHKMLSSPQEHFPFVRAIANVWHFNSFSITPQFKHGIVSLLIVTFLFCSSSYHAVF